ncbi:MAG TPA: oligosaccharide flippase family protein [Pyrinomonadaceae bacterium]|nr:oligosaccharide flippase family protein [Pyrinomonadaceae bacterium]
MTNSELESDSSVGTEPCNPRRESVWGPVQTRSDLFVRNVSTTYMVQITEIVIGLLMLPFNLAHLGPSVYGLWMMAASIPAYFSILDLGYGAAQVRFVSKYRALLDAEGLNEIVSTLFLLFAFLGLAVIIAGAILAYNLSTLFNLTPDEASTAGQVLLIISLYVAVGFPFSVFGAVVNGFQRIHLNSYVAIATVIIVAVVNVVVLLSGYGLVTLVAATTAVRFLAHFAYRANAYRAFPGLVMRLRYVKLTRLREVTGFSSYIFLLDLANKLNYSTDVPIIGAFIGPTGVAVWAVAQRLITATQEMTIQVSGGLFPVVTDIAALGETDRLRKVFLQGTRLSLAMVIPAGTILAVLASPLVLWWVGPSFSQSVPVIWILVAAVIIRVGNSTATTTLKGAGEHSFLTIANITIALANLGLSIVLARNFGIIGVALGTLIPLSVVSIFLLFPRACRRVEIPLFDAFRFGIWPSVWPIIPIIGVLAFITGYFEPSFLNLALQAAGAGGLYTVVFLWVAINRGERNWYLGKIKKLAGLEAVA